MASIFFLAARPSPPEEWQLLRKGDPILEVESRIPELRRYDETTFFASRQVNHCGIVFTWHMYVHVDSVGILSGIEGRSTNEWSGLLDARLRR